MIFTAKARPKRTALPDLDPYPNLKRIVAGINMRRSMFARPQIDLDALTVQNAEAIRLHIETELSPEALYEDGELNHQQVIVKERVLRFAFKELDELLRHRLAV